MKLVNGDVRFELKILGYEFPGAREKYEANWLIVKIDATDQNRTWSATDPCLLTFELIELMEWFENLDTNSDETSEISFMEPALSFRFDPNEGLQVVLDYEFHPDGTIHDDEEYVMRFGSTGSSNKGIAKILKRYLEKYPVNNKS